MKNVYLFLTICMLSCSVVSDTFGPMDCSLPGASVHGDSSGKNSEWVGVLSSRGSSQPRDRIQISHIAGGFFTSWATGNPKNTGVGSQSLQWIFLTQKSNQGPRHCRRILHQLSYQGSPVFLYPVKIFLKAVYSLYPVKITSLNTTEIMVLSSG